MATKKQKRLAGELKQAQNREEVRQRGLQALEADRKAREKAIRDAKVEKSRALLAKHEAKKAAAAEEAARVAAGA